MFYKAKHSDELTLTDAWSLRVVQQSCRHVVIQSPIYPEKTRHGKVYSYPVHWARHSEHSEHDTLAICQNHFSPKVPD